MTIDLDRVRTIIRATHPGKLSPGEADAIVAISQITVDADGQEELSEIQLFFAIGKLVFELTGIAGLPTPTFASDEDDDERLPTLARELVTIPARELAFTVAYILTLATSGGASNFVDNLRSTLTIDPTRAAQIIATVTASLGNR